MNEYINLTLGNIDDEHICCAIGDSKQRHVMTMKDWINATDDLLKFRRKEVLNNGGSISH